MSRDEIVAQFLERAAQAAAEAFETADPKALAGAVALLVQEGKSVFSPAQTDLERAAVRDLAS